MFDPLRYQEPSGSPTLGDVPFELLIRAHRSSAGSTSGEISMAGYLELRLQQATTTISNADEKRLVDLLNILASNIVTLNPSETAVSDAVKAIERLATNRPESFENAPTDNHLCG